MILSHFFFFYNETFYSIIFQDIREDTKALRDFKDMWLIILNQGISVGAFLESHESEKSQLVGANVLCVSTMKDKEQLFADWQVSKMYF